MHEQLMQKDLELESMDISVKVKDQQMYALRKNKLVRAAIIRILAKAKVDLQRSFFLMKMNACEGRLEERNEQTIKMVKQ